MRKSGFPVLLALLLVVLLGMCAGAQAETKKFSGASEAIKWIKKNQPEELTVEGKFKPADLLKVKNVMPEGSMPLRMKFAPAVSPPLCCIGMIPLFSSILPEPASAFTEMNGWPCTPPI